MAADVDRGRFAAMGSDAHLVVVGADHRLTRRLVALVDELERRWSRFPPDSEVSRLNREAGRPVEIHPTTILLVERAVEAWHFTGGSFDPTVFPTCCGPATNARSPGSSTVPPAAGPRAAASWSSPARSSTAPGRRRRDRRHPAVVGRRRAGGIVSWCLLAAGVLWGLAISTKATRGRVRLNWMLDLHRFLGGLAVVFVTVHVTSLVLDSCVHFGLIEVLVPLASAWHPVAVAWGVASLYLLLADELTSLARRRLPKRVWHGIHLLSYPTFALATIHGLSAGTDRHNVWWQLVVWTTVAGVAFLTAVRLIDVQQQPSRPRPTAPTWGRGPTAPAPAGPVARAPPTVDRPAGPPLRLPSQGPGGQAPSASRKR